MFAPIGVCAVCTFLTLTTSAKYGLAFSSTSLRPKIEGQFHGRKTFQPLASQYDYGDGDSYSRRQRRGRYSGESANNENGGRGGDSRRRRSSGGRDIDDYDLDYGSRDGDYYNEKGRNRYSSDGRKKERSPRGGRSGRGGRGRVGRVRGRGEDQQQQRERPPTPPLDSRPTYFTCRHTYENSLRLELLRSMELADIDEGRVSFSKPHPGLVLAMAQDKVTTSFLTTLNPAYALQVMPDSVVVQAESIKGLAREIMEKLLSTATDTGEASGLLRSELVTAPKGSLAIHSLVPEMGRGMPESQLPQYRRVTKIGEELATQLKKRCRAARANNDEDDDQAIEKEQWLLQILLLEPQIIAASFSRCAHEPQSATKALPNWTWPNWNLPAGLALVDIEEEQRKASIQIPSSAYRKLLEAFWYLGERPPPDSEFPVVDLGACPGGWTGALRLMGCNVIALDRSPLDPSLMRDDGVEYIQGDAFRFVPPWARNNSDSWPGETLEKPFPNTWMVSDIIAYPDKITELLDDWCGKHWVSHAVVTIKFQSEIFWEDIENAKRVVEGHGYNCRAVHFFNNKNEVTFLAIKEGYSNGKSSSETLLGQPMYSSILPKPKLK